MDPRKLFEIATEATSNAVCPVSNFPVGAAILSEGGQVYTGCNVESPSLLQSVCAERVALLKALSEGARKFTMIAISTPKRPGASPCGVCRQMLFEFAPGIRIIREKEGTLIIETIEEMLPEGFRQGTLF